MSQNWNIDREKIIAALMLVLGSTDNDKVRVEAAKALVKADELNAKREALAQRQQKQEDDRRLQLLELAQRIPVGELAKLASSNGTVSE